MVTLERSETLARIAAENFRRLQAANIEVVHTSAEEYLQRPGLHFDWIFADPDRRSADGRKLVRLEACSPDVTALMPLIARASGRLCIKNSPLFDVDEALRLFLPRQARDYFRQEYPMQRLALYDVAPLETGIRSALHRTRKKPGEGITIEQKAVLPYAIPHGIFDMAPDL